MAVIIGILTGLSIILAFCIGSILTCMLLEKTDSKHITTEPKAEEKGNKPTLEEQYKNIMSFGGEIK